MAVKSIFKRTVFFILPDVVIDWLKVLRRYRATYGALPNLRDPKTFNEKLAWRLLFEKRAIFTQFSDKAAVRDYVRARLGAGILTKLYALTDKPDSIDFDALPQSFVIKPTHGSGWVKIVQDKMQLDKPAMIHACHNWLGKNYYHVTRDPFYKNIKPQILIEELIQDGNDTSYVPMDYKFFVFGGKVKFIQVHAGRYIDHRNSFYTPDWQKTDIILQYGGIEQTLPRPPHLDEMIAAAETLGAGVDFIRVDLYDTPQRVYFGEITSVPGCGGERFNKSEYDVMFGGLWELRR